MNRHDKHLLGVTLFALVAICALAFAPFTVLVSMVGLIVFTFVLAGVLLIVHAVTRPMDETDEYCSRVDLELDREREARRLRRQLDREADTPPVIERGSGFRIR
jgi:fatty acid desaturase